jgi:hypothetical protein
MFPPEYSEIVNKRQQPCREWFPKDALRQQSSRIRPSFRTRVTQRVTQNICVPSRSVPEVARRDGQVKAMCSCFATQQSATLGSKMRHMFFVDPDGIVSALCGVHSTSVIVAPGVKVFCVNDWSH